jgi:hypothetical protein
MLRFAKTSLEIKPAELHIGIGTNILLFITIVKNVFAGNNNT